MSLDFIHCTDFFSNVSCSSFPTEDVEPTVAVFPAGQGGDWGRTRCLQIFLISFFSISPFPTSLLPPSSNFNPLYFISLCLHAERQPSPHRSPSAAPPALTPTGERGHPPPPGLWDPAGRRIPGAQGFGGIPPPIPSSRASPSSAGSNLVLQTRPVPPSSSGSGEGWTRIVPVPNTTERSCGCGGTRNKTHATPSKLKSRKPQKGARSASRGSSSPPAPHHKGLHSPDKSCPAPHKKFCPLSPTRLPSQCKFSNTGGDKNKQKGGMG